MVALPGAVAERAERLAHASGAAALAMSANLVGERLDEPGAAERVGHLGRAGLELDDLLRAQRDLVRLDVAKELTFTGRIVEATEAAQLGLVTRVCDDPLAEAHTLAREIAANSPHAIAAAKQLLETAWRSSTEEGLKLEESLQRTLIGTPNQIEAATAKFEKRPPKFSDRK